MIEKILLPTVKIWCLPEDLGEEKLLELHNCIVKLIIMNFGSFGIKDERDTLNLFPRDLMHYGLGSEIKIEISDLPQCSVDALTKFANNISKAAKDIVPKANVFCKAESYNPAAGYACLLYQEAETSSQCVDQGFRWGWASAGK